MKPIKYSIDDVDYELEPVGTDSLSPHDLHVIRVYQDTEFNDNLVELEKEHDTAIKLAIGKSGSTHSNDVLSFFDRLAKDWRITNTEALFKYMGGDFEGNRLARVPNEQPMLVDWNSLLFDKRFTVEFNLDKLNKSHLEELWVQIEKRQRELNSGKLKRNRTPENDELIYAIFKARKNGMTYEEIARDYNDSSLNGYSGGNSQYDSADDLGRYYRKYQP